MPSPSDNAMSSRNAIVDFLHALFHLHPNNTCQPSHIEPLRKVYGGSITAADMKILSIFQLFESTRKTSVSSMLCQWSTSQDVSSDDAFAALQSLEPTRVLKTCLEYPDWRNLEATSVEAHIRSSVYDPVFVMLLFAQAFTDGGPQTALAWVQMFRTNVVSLILRTLSARDARLREIAWSQIAGLYKSLEVSCVTYHHHGTSLIRILERRPAREATCLAHPDLVEGTCVFVAHGRLSQASCVYYHSSRTCVPGNLLSIQLHLSPYSSLLAAASDTRPF